MQISHTKKILSSETISNDASINTKVFIGKKK